MIVEYVAILSNNFKSIVEMYPGKRHRLRLDIAQNTDHLPPILLATFDSPDVQTSCLSNSKKVDRIYPVIGIKSCVAYELFVRSYNFSFFFKTE